jgi:hypothetical protein
LAPALPGAALLLGWWVNDLVDGQTQAFIGTPRNTVARARDPWDQRALRGTALLLMLASLILGAALVIVGADSWDTLPLRTEFVSVSLAGLAVAAALAVSSWQQAGRGALLKAAGGLLLAYCALLVGPASQIYGRVDTWQDLASVGGQLRRDSAGRDIILFTPDETTRAFIDMYTRTSVILVPAPMTAQSPTLLQSALDAHPHSVVIAQLPGRSESPTLRALRANFGSGQPSRVRFPVLDTLSTRFVSTPCRMAAAMRFSKPPTRRDKPFHTARFGGSMKNLAPWRFASAAATCPDRHTNRAPHPRPNARRARRNR